MEELIGLGAYGGGRRVRPEAIPATKQRKEYGKITKESSGFKKETED